MQDIPSNPPDRSPEAQELEEAGERLKAYCSKHSINCEETRDFVDDLFYEISIPNGRNKRLINASTTSKIDQLLHCDFRKYSYLGRYTAICSYSDKTIEAGLRDLGIGGIRRLASIYATDDSYLEDDEPLVLNLTCQHRQSGLDVSISPPSNAFRLFSWSPRKIGATLKISNIPAKQHDEAILLLEKVSDAVLFQIDMTANVALGLMHSRTLAPRTPRKLWTKAKSGFEFPRFEYDHAPLILYQYARFASGMPLLQFLAYYQAIEYYYPTYSQAEATRRLKSVIKSPGFRPDSDTDIGQLLTVMSSGKSGLGDERSQLRATLQECLDEDSLRNFLEEHSDRSEFFAKKVEGLTEAKLSIKNPNSNVDLRNEVADRIY